MQLRFRLCLAVGESHAFWAYWPFGKVASLVAMEYLKHCVVPEGEAFQFVPQDPGFDIRLGSCGHGVESTRIQPLNEKLKGIWIVLGKGDFVVLDDGVEEGRMVREQILWDAPGGRGLGIAHSDEDGGRISQPDPHQYITDAGILLMLGGFKE